MQLIPPSPIFLDNETLEEPQEPLALDQVLLLDRLRRLRAEGAIGAIRHGVVGLKAELASDDSRLRRAASAAATITFMPDYLDAELDQIAAAYTLDRARYYLDRFIKSVTEVRTGAINDINLNRWKEYEDIYTDSLWLV